jgi:tetratricopeptide (TPR) repeat protein
LRPVLAATGFGAPGVLAGLVLLAGLMALAAMAFRRRSADALLALLALLGSTGLLAPVARLAVGFPETAAPLYERHLYLAALAGPLALGLATRSWRERAPGRFLLACVLLAVPVGLQAARRAQAWSSDEAFARAGLAAAPQSASLWNHLGVARLEALREHGDAQAGREALEAFERARVLDPRGEMPALNRFITLVLLGRRADAEEAAALLVRDFPREAVVLDNVAQWHLAEGRARQAAELFARELGTGRPLPGAEEGLEQALQELERATGAEAGARAPPEAAGAEGGT